MTRLASTLTCSAALLAAVTIPAHAENQCEILAGQLQSLMTQQAGASGCPPDKSAILRPLPVQPTAGCKPNETALQQWNSAHLAQMQALSTKVLACATAACPAIKPAGCQIGLGCGPLAEDRDGDGILDVRESQLINRFRPYLRFTDSGGPESNRPVDPVTFLKESSLVIFDTGHTLIPNAQLAATPTLAVTSLLGGPPANILLGFGPDPSFTSCPNIQPEAAVALHPSGSSWQSGADWSVVMSNKNVGMFAHVSPFVPDSPADLPGDHSGGVATCARTYSCKDPSGKSTTCPVIPPTTYKTTCKHCIKIEYYQFFAYNNAHHAGIADHEGDLSIVTLVYDSDQDKAVAVSHWIHGMEVRYDLQHPASLCTKKALWSNQPPGPQNTQLTCTGVNNHFQNPELMGGANFSTVEDLWQAQNNEVSFANDPANPNTFEHPIVYVEYGSHEFWPTTRWTVYAAPSHAGNDFSHSYLAENIPNLGEIEHPLFGDEGQILVEFSGRWGASNGLNPSSPGPSLHTTWNWFTKQRPVISCSQAEN